MNESQQRNRYPDFLIIGAMKSGTTTLASDLDTHPKVEFPGGKEVGDLRQEDVLSERGRSHYGQIFAGTPADIKVGDAHPAYSYDVGLDVPGKARELCGQDVRLVYIMRDPISRAISHHTHLFQYGGTTADVDLELRNEDLYIDFSLYARQIKGWLDTFERRNFLFLRFEDYIGDRTAGYTQAIRHIGLEPMPHLLGEDAHNQAEDRRLPTLPGQLPRRLIRKWRPAFLKFVPAAIHDAARKSLTRPAPAPPEPPCSETLHYLADRFSPDMERLQELLGDDAPQWDLEATIDSLLEKPSSSV